MHASKEISWKFVVNVMLHLGFNAGPQKCTDMYGNITVPQFKLHALPQHYSICYVSECSAKLDNLVDIRNFESCAWIIDILQSSDFFGDMAKDDVEVGPAMCCGMASS